NLIDSEPFPADPDEIVDRLIRKERGEVLEEEEKLLSRLDADTINFEGTKADRERLEDVVDGELIVEFPNVAGEILRERARELAVEVGVVESEEEYSELAYEVGIKLSKRKVRETVEERDKMIIQAINTIDDIDRILNILTDRVREWYGIHFPEINKIVKKHDDFVTLVAELADGTVAGQVSGQTTGRVTGNTITFDPLPQLPVKGEAVYKVRVKGTAAGDTRFRVKLACDQIKTPVSKEENTRFYKE
ncbi:MAG: hypothetical protein ABGY75_09995, partial [Gemmataceae bacterium]